MRCFTAMSTQGAGLRRRQRMPIWPQAIWIDLYHPTEEQVQAVAALGYDIPTLADMEEIEISNRLYTDKGTTYMTGVLPGRCLMDPTTAMPVTFILNGQRWSPCAITIRARSRPSDAPTVPAAARQRRAHLSGPDREITGRLADLRGRLEVLDTRRPRSWACSTTRGADRCRRCWSPWASR